MVAAAQYSNDARLRETLLERTRAMGPWLRENAAATEAARRMLPETHRRMTEAGLFRVPQPRAFGGMELPLDILMEIGLEISRHSGSDGWTFVLVALHNWLLGLWPEQAQREFFAEVETRVPVVLAPTGQLTPVDGGWRISGRWGYASGVDISNWVGVAGMDPTVPAGAPPRVLTLMMPTADLAVDDDWFVLGLRGTGSKSVVAKDVFVPSHRAMSLGEAEAKGAPGHAINRANWFRGLPRVPIFALFGTTPAVGIARGMLDMARERALGRKNPYMQKSQAEQVPTQLRLAHAAARIDASERLLLTDLREYQALTEPPSLETRGRMRMHCAQALQWCTEAVDMLFVDAGTSAMFDNSPMQRCFRDIHAIHSHIAMNLDGASEQLGRVMLGMPPNSPMI